MRRCSLPSVDVVSHTIHTYIHTHVTVDPLFRSLERINVINVDESCGGWDGELVLGL